MPLALVVILIALAGGTAVARRLGYKVGGKTIVRCKQGHLFTTLWLPGASFKAIRLGPVRFQRCPVGKHWTFVKPVKRSALTDAEREMADGHIDGPIP